MHILLVDDYEKTREYVFEPLKRAGYSVDMAEDGKDGLLKGMTMDYDVIILDVMLPKVDGVEVLRLRRGDGKASAGVLHPAGIGDAIVPGEMTGQRTNRSTLTSRSNCY